MLKVSQFHKEEEKDSDNSPPNENFSTCGVRNAGNSCYLNCFLQIIANYSPIFSQFANFKPEKELENLLYVVIQKLVQSNNEISANSFLREVGRDLNINIASQQIFFDILNGLCKKLPIISDLFKFHMDIEYYKKKAKVPFQINDDERFYLINFYNGNISKPDLSAIFNIEKININGEMCTMVKKLTSLPKILTFSIEYRSYDKINLAFETTINLNKYCNILHEQNVSYQLYAILAYEGHNLGHYIVYIHNIEFDQWIEYNDSKVTKLKSLKNVNEKLQCLNISGLFYIQQYIFNDFQDNKKAYEEARDMFCKQIFIENNTNLLSVNEAYDEYWSYSSTTSDIDDSKGENDDYYSDISDDDDDNFSNISDDDDDHDNFSDTSHDDASLLPKKDGIISDNDDCHNRNEGIHDIDDLLSITFRHGAIDYVDTRKNGNLNKYLDEAPAIPNDKNHFKLLSDINKHEKHPVQATQKHETKKTKRLNVKTSETQRKRLQELYNMHQDTWPIEKYSIETGIRENNCKRLIKEIRSNQPLESTTHKRGRKPKINVDKIRLLESTLDKDPYLTLKDLQVKLKNECKLSVSKTQIWEGIVGNTNISKSSGCHIYSFKMASKRDPKSNSTENKIIRKERVQELSQALLDGYEWVCIDETRFDIGYIRVKWWRRRGKRLYVYRKKKGFSCSGLTAIGPNGMLYCTLFRGKVTAEIYDAFLEHLVKELNTDGPLVLWMDNAKIHEHAIEKFKNSRHKIIFNAPYSPELNPIENIFGTWKDKIIKEIVRFNSEAELLELIEKTFQKIDPAKVRSTLETTRWIIFPKAYKLDDLWFFS